MTMAILFYENPVLLNANQHANAGLREITDLGYAHKANAIPVNLVEFAQAARHYPIVWTGQDEQFPAAIVGLREDNLFVDDKGTWKAGKYIPAYVRRYPFIFADDADRSQLSLCIEESALTKDGGRPLFADGKPTPATDQALEFCKSYHAAAMATQEFSKAVAAQGLLTDRQANAQLNTGGSYVLQGFKMVDPAKLQQLPGDVLADWNAKGWLAPLFMQVQSMLNWGDLVDMLAGAEAASKGKEDAPKGKKVKA